MKFTKPAIAALKLPSGKTDHFEWDDATPGFGVRIRESGSKSWVAIAGAWPHPEARYRRCAADRAGGGESGSEAVLCRVDAGPEPAEARREARAKAAVTVGAVIEKYLAARRQTVRLSTYRHRYLRRYFAPLHGCPVDAVTRRDVALAVAEIAKAHKPVAAARARSALSAFYSWALKEGVAGESNPVEHTNVPADETPRERVLSPAEIRAIWRACPLHRRGDGRET
jgi:hypothetical protein